MKLAPVLTQLGIPLNAKVLNVLVKEIMTISHKFPEENIMICNTWKDQTNQLVNIPVCKIKKTFDRINRLRRFIYSLPEYI